MMSMLALLIFWIPFSFFIKYMVNFMVLYLMLGMCYYFYIFWFFTYYTMISYSFGGDILFMCMVFLSFWIVALTIVAS